MVHTYVTKLIELSIYVYNLTRCKVGAYRETRLRGGANIDKNEVFL